MPNNENPGILRNLRVKRVSLVDVGANTDPITGDGAHIVLFKRDFSKDVGLGGVHVDSTDWRDDYEKATLDSASRNKLPDSAFAAVWTDSKGVKQRKLPIHDAGHLAAARGRLAAADIPADVKAAARRKIEAATNKGNKKEKNVKKSMLKQFLGLFGEADATKRAAAAAEIEKALDDNPDNDDIEKVAHDPNDPACKCADCMKKRYTPEEAVNVAVGKALLDVEKRHKDEVAKLTDANTKLAASIEVEKGARLDAEMRTFLKSFRHTPFDLDKDVSKFRKMKESDPELYDRTMEVFKGVEAQLAASAIYGQFGSNLSGGARDAWSEIEALADKLVEKDSSGKLTREQAIEKVSLDPKNMPIMKRYREQTQ